jgi:hypothetical protein
MADLITASQFKSWMSIGDTTDDTIIGYITPAVSSAIRKWCGRSFEAATSGTRYFHPLSPSLCYIDDCTAFTSVATDDADDGLWSTTWAAGDYYAEPAANIGPDGMSGWPYTKLTAVESRRFPYVNRPAVKIVGTFGWAAVPGDVTMAALMLAAEQYRAKAGGFDTFTTDANFTQIRRNVLVRDLLQPYRTSRANDARFVVL